MPQVSPLRPGRDVSPTTDSPTSNTYSGSDDQRPSPLSTSRRLPLHHLQLLSPASLPWPRINPQSLRVSPRTNPQAIRLRRPRLRHHARARASSRQRTEEWYSRSRNSSPQAVCHSASETAPVLADALLRLQRLESREDNRKAALYAPQSGEAGSGFQARRLGVVQLSSLQNWDGRNRGD